MPKKLDVFKAFRQDYEKNRQETMTLSEYLKNCSSDRMMYASVAERLVAAIGEPKIVDTSKDPRLSRIFMNRNIKHYEIFNDFYGMEDTIEKIVGYFTYAAQGLEEAKQILYLLGPVGGGKSSLAERLKALVEEFPIYVLTTTNPDTDEFEISPYFESPLSMFDQQKFGEKIEDDYNIPRRYLNSIMGPWAVKRLQQYNGDITKFAVVKLIPSRLTQTAIIKTEPGDENNQDISSLVGKVDIRKLEYFSQNDPDAYSFSGALCRGNQGLVEFVEMFKAPIKVLHPLLTATQEGNYIGTENIPAIPFNGIVMAHSNEAEWQQFRNNKNNEAFLDRICVIKVPYCLRVDEEAKIYEKMLTNSSLKHKKCAPQTLDMLSKFSVLTRLKEHENSNVYSKLRIYNGENLRDIDPKAKSTQEYRDAAGVNEGMDGVSTRFAFKRLSETFNFDSEEIAADPVHLMYVLEKAIKREQFSQDNEDLYLEFLKTYLAEKYAEFVGKEIQKAFLESYSEYGQNLFERYIAYADAWIENIDFKDPDTGNLMDREILNKELEKIEKTAEIVNAKDFREEVVRYVFRYRSDNHGESPKWTSYEKIRDVIEQKMFANTEELLPIISYGSKKTGEEKKKHTEFVERLKNRGYSERQVRRLVDWFLRHSKSG